jgi:hypothetical protein
VKIKGVKIMDKQKAIRVISILLIVLLIATVSVTIVSAKYMIIIKSKSYKTTSSPTSYCSNWAGPSNPGYGDTATFGNQFASPHIIWVDIGGADDVSGFPDGLGGPCELSGYTVISGNYGIW